MTLVSRLKTTTLSMGRTAVGVALGISLAAALLAGAPRAFAQDAAPAHDHAAIVQATGDGPALWSISDADSTLYLFGTVHVLRPDTPWGSAKVDAAFDASQNVIFEISNPDDQSALMPLIQQYGLSPQTPLSSLLTPEELADLDVAAQTVGGSAAQFDPLRPWLVALSLSVAPLTKAGYDPASGVELILKHRAEEAGKPVTGLETIDRQVEILAGLSQETQLAFLRATLEDFDEATTELDTLVNAWAEGDVETINRVGVLEMRRASQEIYDALLTRRNTVWADQIQTILAGSGVTFIAVGSAHLAGDDSVQAILEARGVEVTRH
ncbi:TraB/GumN family protein [Brevundimonas sp.]|uniref:TraB/GumN family protein n=1 Tax=Brevundimonas sp. TaxID=1871086 RepID=UPI0026320DF1|nr:TraB/GumN family protein [Brevundimonas sp.]